MHLYSKLGRSPATDLGQMGTLRAAKRSGNRTREWRWVAVTSIMVLSAGLPIAGGSVAAAATPTFSSPVEIDGSGHLTGVSCSDAVDCTAVGISAGDAPTITTETNGTWASMIYPPLPGGYAHGEFYAVSCTNAINCTAVGADGQGPPIYATKTNGTWGPITEVAPYPGGNAIFTGVSCTDAMDCTAVGYDGNNDPIVATETSGTWGPPFEMNGAGLTQVGNFEAVSCIGTLNCTAVGVATVPDASRPGGFGVVPIATTEKEGTWGPLVEVSGDNPQQSGFFAVSCGDSAHCTAVGSGPIVGTDTNGSWNLTSALPAPGGSGFFTGVSCNDALDCTAVGGDGLGNVAYASESSGIWGSVTEDPNPVSGGVGFRSVSCTDTADCTAVGEGSSDYPVVATTSAVGGGVSAPAIGAVSPYFGPAAGATKVTFTGTNLSGSTVKFGSASASAVSCTATSCTATSPAGTGTIDITATTFGGTSATSTADQFTYEPAPPPGSTSSASGASNTAGGTATASNAGTTASGHGRGAVTVAQYPSDPATPATFTSSGEYLDVAVSPGNTFTSVAIQDCNLNGGNTLEWFNPAANSGAGAWQPVVGDPGPIYSAGPPCVAVILDSTTSPTVSQLSGTVFGVKAPTPTTLTATPAIVELFGLKVYLFGLNGTLRTSAGPVAGQTITFKAGSTVLCSAITAANGTASCNAITSVLSIVLSLGYNATYRGTADYLPSSAKAALIS
jgi:IPT/TIG domain